MAPPTHALLLALQSTEAPPEGPDWKVLLIGTIVIFYLVAFLPERKARKKKQALLDSVKKNDRVLLTNGFFATVAALGETEVTVKFDDGQTRAKVLRSAIQTVLDKDGGDAAD